MENIGLWHQNDLRIRDNRALDAAVKDGNVSPIFIFDPEIYTDDLMSDRRLAFLHESLQQLDEQYNKIGSNLIYFHGDPEQIIKQLLNDNTLDNVYFNSTVDSGYIKERNESLLELDDVRRFEDDAIVRNGRSRDGWREQAESYFEKKQINRPTELTDPTLTSNVSLNEIKDMYSVDSTINRRHFGGCLRGEDRLNEFINNISDYVGGISPPIEAEKRTSQISPYIVFGCISLRQAYRKAQQEADDGRAKQMFISRLFWNRHFTQKLADNEELKEKAVNPVFRGINRATHNQEYHEKWKRGLTGYPMVDASMRALRQTGWMNFRMRAMCASFYSYILRCWWKRGADWFYKNLIDADPAINYAQWQMQSGLVGVHPLRIYNPRKQVKDNDPEGEYIKKYVPELKDMPVKYLDSPEKAPLSVQEENDVIIGEDYPYPIVGFESKRKEARDYWASLDDRAKEALKDPEVFKRASLSRDSREDLKESEIEPKSDDNQQKITDF